MSPTLCETCEHVHPSTRTRRGSQWACLKFPALEGGSFVAPTEGVPDPPYMRCIGINGGACPLWKQRRTNDD